MGTQTNIIEQVKNNNGSISHAKSMPAGKMFKESNSGGLVIKERTSSKAEKRLHHGKEPKRKRKFYYLYN